MATKIIKNPQTNLRTLKDVFILTFNVSFNFGSPTLSSPRKQYSVLTLAWHLLYQTSPTESQQKDTFDSHVAGYLACNSLPSKNLVHIHYVKKISVIFSILPARLTITIVNEKSPSSPPPASPPPASSSSSSSSSDSIRSPGSLSKVLTYDDSCAASTLMAPSRRAIWMFQKVSDLWYHEMLAV